MKVGIYARVSTQDQSCSMQLAELRTYCAARNWDIYDEYVDTISGSKACRPRMNALMQDARLRRFDAVLVWKLDRWGRSLIHCVHSIQELASAGVRFIAVTQGIDTDENSPTARLLMNIFATFAEFEREMIRERVTCGLKSARQKGKTLGRPRKIFRVDEALRLREAGLSWRTISKQLGVPEATLRLRCSGCAEIPLASSTKTSTKHIA